MGIRIDNIECGPKYKGVLFTCIKEAILTSGDHIYIKGNVTINNVEHTFTAHLYKTDKGWGLREVDNRVYLYHTDWSREPSESARKKMNTIGIDILDAALSRCDLSIKRMEAETESIVDVINRLDAQKQKKLEEIEALDLQLQDAYAKMEQLRPYITS